MVRPPPPEAPARRHDWAVVQPGRLHLIELKTKRGSHRPGQGEHYLDLGRHHHPAAQVDLVYVTPPMAITSPAGIPERCRYHHHTWELIGDLVADVWADSPHPDEAALARFTPLGRAAKRRD